MLRFLARLFLSLGQAGTIALVLLALFAFVFYKFSCVI